MGAMGIPMRAVLAMAALLLLCGSVVEAFDGYNGMPRPAGMDQAPTTTYGPKPAVQYKNKAAKCTWYGWENGNYPPAGTHNCSTSLWASLSVNPSSLSAFMYYVPLEDIYYDPMYQEYLCAIGCFDLAASGPVLAPTASPPAAGTPPVLAPTVSPPAAGTPPATLFRPPPPAAPLPPSLAPTTMAVPPSESPALSPETSPVSSPGSSPLYSPAPTTGGPSFAMTQAGSATTTSAPTVLAFTAALFLCINLLL